MSHADRQSLDEFRTFLGRYYGDEIARLAQRYPQEQRSLTITYDDLYQFDPTLAEQYVDHPRDSREIAEEALRTIDLPVDVSLGSAHVRLHGLGETHTWMPGEYSPTDQVGEYRALEGEISRATEVYPRIVEAAFECQRCGTMTYIPQSSSGFREPHECQGCERQGPFRIDNDQSEFVDAQKLELKRPPEHAEGDGETIEVDVEDDLCGTAEVGDRVVISGHLHMRQQELRGEKSARFEQWFEAHHIAIDETDHRELDIDQETRERIRELVDGVEGDPLVVAGESLTPQIYGYETIKQMLVLSMVGGSHVAYPSDDTDRGTVHVLLLGDPGTSKSKLIDRVESVGWRTVGVSGKGATVAGVTATATQDEFGPGGSEWTLKAGAMVRAHRGTVPIDELDDMPSDVRDALLEPMSKQHIFVTKGGINTKLQTRTTVVAASNPRHGRFDEYESLPDQVPFDSNLVSRFDLVFLLTDQPKEDRDRQISEHILQQRDGAKRVDRSGTAVSDTEMEEPPVEPDVLRAWIALAKRQPDPVFEDESVLQKIRDQFTELRGLYDYDDDSPVPVTFRQLESIVRIAEAAARFEFSEVITERHARIATEAVGESMRDFQTDADGNLDADVVETGTSFSQRDRIDYVRDLILELEDSYPQGRVPRQDIVGLHDEKRADEDADAPSLSGETIQETIDHVQKQGAATREGDGWDGEVRWLGFQ
jgi:replicative DNA helicase Mcm